VAALPLSARRCANKQFVPLAPKAGLTRDVEIVVYPSDNPRPGKNPVPWIGVVHGIKPTMRPALFVSHADFNRVWTLAVSGQLKHAYMVLTPPRYQTAFVTHLSFSTHPEE